VWLADPRAARATRAAAYRRIVLFSGAAGGGCTVSELLLGGLRYGPVGWRLLAGVVLGACGAPVLLAQCPGPG
jgi:hypothetical protein